jgi:hypothetical protein
MTNHQPRGLSLATLAAGLVLAGCSHVPLTESNTCDLAKPPENSIRRIASQTPDAPTLISFPDPKEVPANYSGCLNTWIAAPGKDIRVVEAKFVDGRIKWSRMGKGEIYCEYENDRVIKQEVDPELRKQMQAANPKASLDAEFCPPGAALVPSKWK